MTANLTISLLVRNEEHSLGRCLDSVQGLADEIVVVDTRHYFGKGNKELNNSRQIRKLRLPLLNFQGG